MSPRLTTAFAVLACAFAVAPAAAAEPPPLPRNNANDCDVFNASDDGIQSGLGTIDDVVAGYFTYWVGNSYFGDEQYPDFDPGDIQTILAATQDVAGRADSAQKRMQTPGAALAMQRVANDSRAVHDAALKVSSGEYRPRQLGFVKDVLFKSVDNYNRAYGIACDTWPAPGWPPQGFTTPGGSY